MKTRVYIDGYNFYYGCLKGSHYKWLNLVSLFENHILPASAPQKAVLIEKGIKFFTAKISEKAAKSNHSVSEQDAYLRALSSLPNQIEAIKGYYAVDKVPSHLVDQYQPSKFPKHCQKVETWKLEEKQSDVNLAIEAVYDVVTNTELEQVVFVTNDTDLAPAIVKVKQHNPKIVVGLVIPTKKSVRYPNAKLVELADWTREHISDDELFQCQFPRVVKTEGRKDVIKPQTWFGESEILEQIMNELLSVFNKRNKCWQWLETPKPEQPSLPKLNGLPINLLDSKETALAVLEHAKAYAKFKM